jgi:hypothetical protein
MEKTMAHNDLPTDVSSCFWRHIEESPWHKASQVFQFLSEQTQIPTSKWWAPSARQQL